MLQGFYFTVLLEKFLHVDGICRHAHDVPTRDITTIEVNEVLPHYIITYDVMPCAIELAER